MRPVGSRAGSSDGEVALRFDHVEILGVDRLDVEPVGNVLAFVVGFALVFGADGTPELRLVRTVPAALNVDTETDQLLAVVLDHRVLPYVGVAADDEVVHMPAFACSGLNRF